MSKYTSVILSQVPEGQLIVLQDGTPATKTGEENGLVVLTEATHQSDQWPGGQFYFSDQALVFQIAEEE